MNQVVLKNNKGFRWFNFSVEHVCVWSKGDAFLENQYITESKLPELLYNWINTYTIQELTQKIALLNGCFSFACETETSIFLCVDRWRSFPLFYTLERPLIITDEAEVIRQSIPNICLKQSAIDEFRMFGYVTGFETLLERVFQVQAGQLVIINKNDCSVFRQFYYLDGYERKPEIADKTLDEKAALLDECLTHAFQRLVHRLNGRTAVISLSGGQDSRLIAFYLKKLGYEKILAYTFGKEGNIEVEKAKQVANKLGIKWHFIPYGAEDWKPILKGDRFDDYYRYAGNYTSVAHMATVIAIEKMMKSGILPKDGVFLNGGVYDVTTGSWTQIDFVFNDFIQARTVKQRILYRHGVLLKFNKKIWEGVVEKTLNNFSGELSSSEAIGIMNKWYSLERGPKFTHNTVRGYEYFEYPWYTPLEDNELDLFWKSVDKMDYYSRFLHFVFAEKYMNPYTGIEDSIPQIKYDFHARLRNNYLFMQVGHKLREKQKRNISKLRDIDTLDFYACYTDQEIIKMGRQCGVAINGNIINLEHYLRLLNS